MKRLLFFCVFSLCVFTLKAQKIPVSTSNAVYTINTGLDQLPQFPGGMNELSKFLIKNLKWPPKATEVPRRVIISFIVEKDGSLSHFKVDRKGGLEVDKEVLRVIRLSPKWIPGMKNGKRVRSKYFLPVSVDLSAN